MLNLYTPVGYGGDMKTLNIVVEGMNCGGCVKKITNHFENVEGVMETTVSLEDKNVIIKGSDELSNMKIRNDIIELGFQVMSIQKA